MTDVTIVRPQWDRGREQNGDCTPGSPHPHPGRTYLYNSARAAHGEAAMCCFGFVCEALGVTREHIIDQTTPANVYLAYGERAVKPLILVQVGCVTRHLGWVQAAMAVNDDPAMSDEAREATLTALMAPHGIHLHFVDEVPA